ncbi:virulence factor BrkB family protein [Thalassotalea sp. PLHSN55]|uniref:virulence factor BrkB family protein n=1 Tax=Thalassotalea sp. PLHSN55 TaxID=3435888 RepID=UPI003F877596
MKKINQLNYKVLKEAASVFLPYFFKRLQREHIHVVAGYLSYVTLMSLVPLLVVMLSVMTAFPIFADIRTIVEEFIYHNFVPAASDVVQQHLSGFVANASKMSAVAISFLFLFALLLISAIDKTLNKIWQVTEKRRIITAFSMYWMVLTLGPVLVGSSIAASSYLVSLVSFGDPNVEVVTNFFVRLLPLLSSIAAFLILYLLVPNKAVPIKFAFVGAITAAILFEFAKKGFALYVTQLPSYQAIYGALATIPILFLWVYLSWLIVLVGAVLTVSLENYQRIVQAKDISNKAD